MLHVPHLPKSLHSEWYVIVQEKAAFILLLFLNQSQATNSAVIYVNAAYVVYHYATFIT